VKKVMVLATVDKNPCLSTVGDRYAFFIPFLLQSFHVELVENVEKGYTSELVQGMKHDIK
jgi:hypothetical protein